MPSPTVPPLGAIPTANGTAFSVYSRHASHIDLCLFDPTGTTQTARIPMKRDENDIHRITADGPIGTRYGFRADGVYAPDHGLWFDPSKLLLDPYATEIDQPFVHDPALFTFGTDTSHIMPKSIVSQHQPVKRQPPSSHRAA